MLPLLLTLLTAAGGPLQVKDRGATLRSLTAADVLATGKATVVPVHEPHADALRRYRGIPVGPLLDRLYGPRWREAEVVVFGCTDGYQAVVPVEKLRHHAAYLAFDSGDSTPFRLLNVAQHEDVALGPWYLVWKDDPAVRADGGADWPYQVVSVELDTLARRFPKLAPPKGASAAARNGFATFQRQCIACHTINGEGGGKAPELNYPVNVTEYFRAAWLKRWIAAPQAVRFDSHMPALDPTLPDRARRIDELIAYLRAMRGRKLPPAKVP